MSLQDSTFNTTHVLDNEIVKANDFEFAFENLITNVSKATQMFLESNQDFVINGKVLPYQGMNVQISPIFGVCKSTGIPFGRTETAVMEYGFAESTSGRIDIIEVKGDWETFDNQQRAFNDPDTDTQTYQYVDTKKLMRPVYQIKKGTEGGSVAPEVDEGWVKLAEVVIRANASTLLASDIKNITSDVAGEDNEDWTTEPDITYNIGYISDVNARFREQHNEDGSHKDNVINSDSLDIGIGTKQINGNILPVGGTVSIPTQTIANTDSILSVLVKAATMITSLYNAYLKYGNYGFKGTLSLSAVADGNNELANPLSFAADGSGNATVKIGTTTVLSIDSTGKVSTNGYTATMPDHLVTKTVTDAIRTALNNLTARVDAIEHVSNSEVYANETLSSGTNGRFNPDGTSIYAATTENISLQGDVSSIDGVTLVDGVLVLVKDQTDAKENGIYQFSSGSAWSRSTSFLMPSTLKGKLFTVTNGTVNKSKLFYLVKTSFSDPDTFGTDEIPFSEYFGSVKPLANKLIMRDSNGRAKVAAPVESDDIARKAEIDNLYTDDISCVNTLIGCAGSSTTFAKSDHSHPNYSDGLENTDYWVCLNKQGYTTFCNLTVSSKYKCCHTGNSNSLITICITDDCFSPLNNTFSACRHSECGGNVAGWKCARMCLINCTDALLFINGIAGRACCVPSQTYFQDDCKHCLLPGCGVCFYDLVCNCIGTYVKADIYCVYCTSENTSRASELYIGRRAVTEKDMVNVIL